MILIGTTRTTLDPCDCEIGRHSGHVRYLDWYTVRQPWKFLRHSNRQPLHNVRFAFRLNGHAIPRSLGRWLCHRTIFGKQLAHYQINEINVPAKDLSFSESLVIPAKAKRE